MMRSVLLEEAPMQDLTSGQSGDGAALAPVENAIEDLPYDIGWITSPDNPYSLLGPVFAFVSEDHKQCHDFVMCKDYLGDLMFSKVNQWQGGLPMFKVHAAISVDRLRLAFTQKDTKTFDFSIQKSLDLVHQVEGDFEIEKTRVSKVKNPVNHYKKIGMYLFEASGDWISSPVMLSLYTLLMRLNRYHEVGVPWMDTVQKVANPEGVVSDWTVAHEKNICSQAVKGLKRLAKEGWKNVLGTDLARNYPVKTIVAHTHNNFGISAFATAAAKPWCPHWYKS